MVCSGYYLSCMVINVKKRQQKTFVLLSGLRRLMGWGEGLSESLRKGKFVTKMFFPDAEWSSKNLRKIISADVKANKSNWWWFYLTNFYKKYLQNLKYSVKRECIFHLILVGILSILILSVKNRDGGGLLIGQNLLSMMKVIFQQSLNALLLNEASLKVTSSFRSLLFHVTP